ncbi:hypothetical protein IAD21_01572 [Abditibacteriota bacterium]|nr:hypothetical protein IAD21_01572 [Abditibacteriota bacterium]
MHGAFSILNQADFIPLLMTYGVNRPLSISPYRAELHLFWLNPTFPSISLRKRANVSANNLQTTALPLLQNMVFTRRARAHQS